MSVPMSYLGIVVIWTSTPLAIKWSGEEVGFLFGVVARMAIALVVCFVIAAIWRKAIPLDRRALHAYVSVGIPLYTAMTSVYWGAQFLPSGLISVLFGLTPFFTGLFAMMILSEKSFTPARVAGMLFGVFGLFIIFYEGVTIGAEVFMGMLAVLFAALMHSLGTVWFKHAAVKLPIISVNVGGLTIAMVLYGLTWMITGDALPDHVPEQAAISIVYLAIVGSVFGALLFYYALKRVNASTMGLLPLVTPVTALLLGQWLNNEEIAMSTIIGTALILFGLMVYQWSQEMKNFSGKLIPVRISNSDKNK